MPTNTYTPLATVTLASAAATVTFGSIPSTYRDLIVIFNGSATGASDSFVEFNNDTANASAVKAEGNGSTTASVTLSQLQMGILTNASVNQMFIFDYSATDKHKTILSRGNTASNQISMFAGRWASTSVITQIKLLATNGQSYSSGSTFSLYGVIA